MNGLKTQRLLSMLGIGAKAGALIFGTDQICDALRNEKKKPLLVIEAGDTSDNTHKKLNDKCSYYGVRLERIEADTVSLGYSVGKRAAVAAVGITDAGICRAVEMKLQEVNEK